MADENQEEKKSDKPSFKTADELSSFLMDMQGQMANMQQTIDKLSPVEGAGEGKNEENPDGKEEEKEMSDEEVSEIDKLLQSE